MTYGRASRWRLHLVPPDVDLQQGLIVDVGANEGRFSAAVLSLAPEARIVAVEPAPEPLERLRRRIGERPNVSVVAGAVSDRKGQATFVVTGHDNNSSLRRPRPEMERMLQDPGWRVTDEITVPTTTLDELVGSREVALLKLDVQGGEREVLDGGRLALAHTAAVLLEVTFVSHYEGDATFEELHAKLAQSGFHLVGMSSPARSPAGEATWADACYARTTPPTTG